MKPRPLRALVLFAHGADTTTLSYYYGWPRHLDSHPAFVCTLVNVLDRGHRWRLALGRARTDVVVVLHSVFANEPYLRRLLLERVRRIGAPKVYFVGNEYKLMPEKMAFAERLETLLLVTQLDDPRAHDLYRERLGCDVAYVPYTGLDSGLFHPGPPRRERPIDIGYRAFFASPYVDNGERVRLARDAAERAAARDFVVDAALGAEARFAEPEWAEFLRRCKAQFGSEAGGDWFDLTDERRLAFAGVGADAVPVTDPADAPASGRALSGRVVEAAGTMTVQLLLEGRYGGFFEPGRHYLPLRRDLSNLDETLDLLADDELCDDLVAAAHERAREQLTYPRLVERLRSALEGVL